MRTRNTSIPRTYVKAEEQEREKERRMKKKLNDEDVDRRVDVECPCLIGIQHCSSFIVHIYAKGETNKCLPLP